LSLSSFQILCLYLPSYFCVSIFLPNPVSLSSFLILCLYLPSKFCVSIFLPISVSLSPFPLYLYLPQDITWRHFLLS
jgi:hypothetical protein